MITLLNTSIITAHGKYDYEPITLEWAKQLISDLPCGCNSYHCLYCGGTGILKKTFVDSAIGHESTAEILSDLLGIQVPVNRQNYVQKPNSKAIVFKLKARAPEGQILSREEIEEIGYEFGLLSRTE